MTGRKQATEVKEEVGKALEDKTTLVEDAIKEELGISDEELEEAMANLGFMPLDLLNPDNVKDLMLELSGENDPMALITNGELLESINNVTDIALSAVNELNEEFGITAEELTGIIEAIKEENIPAPVTEDGRVNNADPAEDIAVVEGNDIKTGNIIINDNRTNVVRDSNEKDDDTDDAEVVVKADVRKDDSRETPIIREESSESVTMQRRAVRIMDERKGDGGMQEAMNGQTQGAPTPVQDMTAAAPVTEAPSPASYVDSQSILDQVRDQIKVNITEDATTMELQLHPASLGTVNLSVASNGGVVTANILVQNEAVKSVLEAQLVQLLETFEEQGQKVEAIEVSVAGYDLDRSLNQGNEQGEQGSRERSSEGIARTSRRRLNLNDLTEEDLEDLTEEEQLAAEMMEANGTSVDYTA
jgi:flagellar hook-length control protein FliK